jgi:arylsulfatase A-like enzyme
MIRLGPISRSAMVSALLLTGGLSLSLAPTPAEARVSQAERSEKRPNIIVFLVDDFGWRDVGYNGSEFYQTPAIDQLARDGMRFDNAYVAFPRCTPSRFALLTGQNPARAQVPGGRGGESMPGSALTMAEALKEGGYANFFFGKWHLGGSIGQRPEDQGFDVNIGGGESGAVRSQFCPFGGEGRREPGPGLQDCKPGEYMADWLTDRAINQIARHHAEQPDQPFLAYVSHYAVHTPIEARDEDAAPYEAAVRAAGGPRQPAYQDRDGQTKLHQDNAEYAGMVASVDRSLARLRSELERLGIADDTIILLTSDHGGLSNRGAASRRDTATSNLPYRAGKGHLYEGGLRIPMVMAWPGRIPSASVSSEVVNNTDYYPTLLDLAGLPQRPAAHIDGVSFAPVFSGRDLPDDRPLYWYSPRPRPDQTGDTASAALRLGGWKYIRRYAPGERDELFNLTTDPYEARNLIDEEAQRAEAMRGQLTAWLTSIDAADVRLGRHSEASAPVAGQTAIADSARQARREQGRTERRTGQRSSRNGAED